MAASLMNEVALGGAGYSMPTRGGSIADPGTDDDAASVATIRAAYDEGIRIFDSARAYAPLGRPLHNEQLFADALRGRADAIIGTKGGHWRAGQSEWPTDNRPERLRHDVEDSLRALGVATLPLYYIHRVDLDPLPFEDGLAELDELRRAGKIERIGLSNATPAQVRAASGITRIDAVQNHLSVRSAVDPGIVAACGELGIALFGYSTLRAAPESGELTDALPRLARLADERGIPLVRLAMRGLLASSPVVSIVSGAGRPETAREAARARVEPWDAELDAAYSADRADPSPGTTPADDA